MRKLWRRCGSSEGMRTRLAVDRCTCRRYSLGYQFRRNCPWSPSLYSSSRLTPTLSCERTVRREVPIHRRRIANKDLDPDSLGRAAACVGSRSRARDRGKTESRHNATVYRAAHGTTLRGPPRLLEVLSGTPGEKSCSAIHTQDAMIAGPSNSQVLTLPPLPSPDALSPRPPESRLLRFARILT